MAFQNFSSRKVSRDFLQALFVVIRYPPCTCVARPVPHTVGLSPLATFFHGRPPFHLVAAFQHSIAVTAETHANLTHAVLAVETSDSGSLFTCDRRPLRPPFAAPSPQPAVEDLPRQEVHGTVSQGHVTRRRTCRGVQLCSQGSSPRSVYLYSLGIVDFQSPLVYFEYSQSVNLLLYEFRGDVFQEGCLR